VLEEKETHISSRDIYGSTHKYVIDKKQLKGISEKSNQSEQVELSIDPSEISTLTEEALKKRAADKFNAEKRDRTDDNDDDENNKKRKRQSAVSDKTKKKKKANDFKF